MNRAIERNGAEHFLLDWLSREDSSAYGECKGCSFKNLEGLEFVRVTAKDVRGEDYDRVALTDAGWAEIKRLGAWKPERGRK